MDAQTVYVSDRFTETTIIRGLLLAEQGPRLTAMRKALDMSQAKIAGILGWPPTTYAMYEQGRRGIDVQRAAELEKFFKVPGEWFLGTVTKKECALLALERGLEGEIHEPRGEAHVPIGSPHQAAHRKPKDGGHR